jgi:hypothetical protein
MTNAEIAEKLGKTRRAVTEKARVLGIKKIRRIVTSSRIAFYEDGPGTKLELEGRLKMQNFYDLDVKVGDKVKVVASDYDSKKLSTKKLIKGEVIYKNDSFITIQGENYKESFLIADFYTGAAKLIKKERQEQGY